MARSEFREHVTERALGLVDARERARDLNPRGRVCSSATFCRCGASTACICASGAMGLPRNIAGRGVACGSAASTSGWRLLASTSPHKGICTRILGNRSTRFDPRSTKSSESSRSSFPFPMWR